MDKRRIPELDGLRGLAISIILAFHYVFLITPTRPASVVSYLLSPGRIGWCGVDLFFVLSGFLIGGILLDARTSSTYYKVFYFRRFLRIVPVYFCFLTIFLLLRSFAHASHQAALSDTLTNHLPIAPYFGFLQNFWMGAYDTLGGNALGVTWSLAIEEQFYLVLPFVIRAIPRHMLPRLLLALTCIAVAIRIAIWFLLPHHRTFCFAMMPCRADALLLGVLGAYALREPSWKRWVAILQTRYVLLFLGCGILVMIKLLPRTGYLLMSAGGYTWIAFFFLCLLLLAVSDPNTLVARVLRLRWLRGLGTVAYGTYLFHEIVLGLVFALARRKAPSIEGGVDLLLVLVSVILTILFCLLSWTYFEQRLIRFGHDHFRYSFQSLKTPVADTNTIVELAPS